jgi:hypothetical protein
VTQPSGARPGGRRGALRTTRIRTLLAVLAVGAALGWTGVRLFVRINGSLPDVPLTAPVALGLLAAVLTGGGLVMRRRVQQWRPGRERVSPDLAVRLLVLAKASALAGAAVAGGYLGAAVAYAADLDVPFRRSSTWWCLGSAALALVVVAAALWLERECRTPPLDADPAGATAS